MRENLGSGFIPEISDHMILTSLTILTITTNGDLQITRRLIYLFILVSIVRMVRMVCAKNPRHSLQPHLGI